MNRLKNSKLCMRYIVALLCVGGVWFSCIDNFQEGLGIDWKSRGSKNKNQELTVDVAQQWYQANYAPVVKTRTGLEVSASNMLMKPSWNKAKEFNRRRYEVVEVPIQTKRHHIFLDAETAKKWQPTSAFKFVRNTAKIVVERDKKTGRTRSFMMVFVGSYNYLKDTRTMGKNSYLYREPDFDGMVLFYELNGTLVNGWKYTNGKITGSIAPKVDGLNKIVTDSLTSHGAQTRSWVTNCELECIWESHEECIDEVSIEYDSEFGESWILTRNCWEVNDAIWIENCHDTWIDDGYDDNWEQDWPSGGSGTSNEGGGNNDNYDIDPEIKDQREQKFADSMYRVRFILASFGIDVSKYTIKLNNNACGTMARTYSDGTIEVCGRFLNYSNYDQASVIWHEIYHIDHGHNKDKQYIPCEPFTLMVDDDVRPYFETFLNYSYDGYGSKEDYANLFLLAIDTLSPIEWYQNEIATHKAELNNGIRKSAEYEAELRFQLWKFEQLYNRLKNK